VTPFETRAATKSRGLSAISGMARREESRTAAEFREGLHSFLRAGVLSAETTLVVEQSLGDNLWRQPAKRNPGISVISGIGHRGE
jgi:hypothetical protein